MTTKQELIDKWNDDGEAWEHLKPNFHDKQGLICPKENYVPTEEDWGAILYLCYEWDYGYEDFSDGE